MPVFHTALISETPSASRSHHDAGAAAALVSPICQFRIQWPGWVVLVFLMLLTVYDN